MKNLTFAKWFEEQHGKRPSWGSRSEKELIDMVERGKFAATILSDTAAWDARRESALYAWTAKERELRACEQEKQV